MKDSIYEVGLGASRLFERVVYDIYTPGHFIQMFASVIIIGALLAFCFRKKHWLNRVLYACSGLGIAMMAILVIYSLVTKVYNLEWYIPLHVCNLFLFLMPIAALNKGKVREFLKDFMVFGGLLGCILQITFPITTMLYFPAFHIVSIAVWVYHMTIGFLGGYLLLSGNYTKYNAFNGLSILTVVVIGAYIANHYLGTNFLFINKNRAVFPMSEFYSAFGNLGSLAVWLMLYAFFVCLQVVIAIYSKIKTKSVLQLLKSLGITEFIAQKRIGLMIVESDVYKYINDTVIVKKLRNKQNILNKLYSALLKSGIIKSLLNSNIESLTNINELESMVISSGVVKNVSKVLILPEIIKLQHSVDEKTESVVEGGAVSAESNA